LRFALLKHDAAIAKVAVRQLTKSPANLLTVLLGLPLLALVARAWLSGLPAELGDLIAYGTSTLVATAVVRALLQRVWFHQTEGALGRYAQRPGDWLSFMLALLVAGIVLEVLAMAAVGILDPERAIWGTCTGITGGFAIPFVLERVRRWWRDISPKKGFGLLRHRHALATSAAVSAAIGAICAYFPQDGYLGPILAGGYGVVVILLSGRIAVVVALVVARFLPKLAEPLIGISLQIVACAAISFLVVRMVRETGA